MKNLNKVGMKLKQLGNRKMTLMMICQYFPSTVNCNQICVKTDQKLYKKVKTNTKMVQTYKTMNAMTVIIVKLRAFHF
jgi:hypothetical protein